MKTLLKFLMVIMFSGYAQSQELEILIKSCTIQEKKSAGRSWDRFFGTKPDPYIILTLNGRVLGQTAVMDNTCNPTFKIRTSFMPSRYLDDIIGVHLFDSDVDHGTITNLLLQNNSIEAILSQIFKFDDEITSVDIAIDEVISEPAEYNITFGYEGRIGIVIRPVF